MKMNYIDKLFILTSMYVQNLRQCCELLVNIMYFLNKTNVVICQLVYMIDTNVTSSYLTEAC